ncbi:MAG: hypothetical protein ACJ8BW_40560 [Ktedonobacteraceae bacterium]
MQIEHKISMDDGVQQTGEYNGFSVPVKCWTNVIPTDDGGYYVFTNGLTGVPLFAWYVFYCFVDEALVGTTFLDDLRDNMYGPYESYEAAFNDIYPHDPL